MAKHFSPSINILVNDIDLSQYFITSNVQLVFDGIINNYRSGIRSINLVGAYGTGKSSFLSALTQHLNGEKVFYEASPWTKLKKFTLLKAISDYDSFINQFADVIGSRSVKPADILRHFEKLLTLENEKGNCVVIIFDEFGKLLEYAAKHEPEKELYFLQQLAEIINNGNHEAVLITTLHQDFGGYANQLSKIQRNEWTKVKGRFKEIVFNEPVEQLLYLASERLNSDVPQLILPAFNALFDCVVNAKVYPLRDFFTPEVAKKLYPLDILSAALLALSLQQYGQNERSLFSFLNGDSYFDLKDFDPSKANFYTINAIYDYLNYNLHSFLHSKINPHYSKWAEIRNALERVDGEFDYKKQSIYYAVVKAIGMFQVFLPSSAVIDRKFLIDYLSNALNLPGVDEAIGELEKKFIIRYYHRNHRYTLYEASDVDIDVAISDAASEISRSNDVVKYLSAYFNFPTISAKRVYFERGTPRVFQFKISDNPYISTIPQGEIDGFVNLVFNTYIEAEDLAAVSADNHQAILYGLYQNPEEIKGLTEEIEKAEIAQEKHRDDRIAKRELDAIIDLQKNLLNHYVMNSFFNPEIVRWFYNGNEIHTITNNRRFNEMLSTICRAVYPQAPIFRSEIANKTKLSPAASTARKDLFQAIFEHGDKEELSINGFPPHKSIYYSLLRETNIHRYEDGGWQFNEPLFEEDPYHFSPLFEACNTFLNSSKGAKRNIGELYEKLGRAPFKLKKGFLDFWIPIFLVLKRSDYAFYGEHGFITDLTTEILELLVKKPDHYSLKAFDVAGIRVNMFNRYREMLQLPQKARTDNEAFIQTITPFMRFHKDLHPYAKNTRRISKQSQKIRKALTDATDPEKLFFEDFPAALGFDLIQLNKSPELLADFTDALQNAIRELRSSYENLLARFEAVINSFWNGQLDFNEYKPKFRARYEPGLKKYLLLPYQRTFYDRLFSPLEDRKAWLSSVAQSVIGKTLEQSNDDDELRLFDRFVELIHELDNLNDISKQPGLSSTDDRFRLEITEPGQATRHKVITVPKEKTTAFIAAKADIELLLSKENRFMKIAILAEMLKKELGNDGK